MSGTLAPSRPQTRTPAQTTAWKANFFRVRGWQSNNAKNESLKNTLDAVLKPGGPGSAAALAKEKLEAGAEFKTYLKCLAAFETDPSTAAALKAAAQAYMAHYDDHSDREKKQKNTLRKAQLCQKTLIELDLLPDIAAIGKLPWDSKTAMKAATIKAELDFASLPFDNQVAEGLDGDLGVSASFWVNRVGADRAKDRSYLFKPAMASSNRPGVPVGGEPARKALTGRAADLLGGMTQIDFKVPETHIVNVGRKRLGKVMPDGISDRNGTGPLIGSLQQFAPSKGELRKNSPALARAVPPERCQELAMLDIVTMHMDRHGGNFMVDGTDQGADLVPIDNGLSFPDEPGALSYMATSHNALLRLPGSHEPFTVEMLKKIARIDPAALKAALKSEVNDIDSVHPAAAGKVSNVALEQSRRAAMFLKLAAPALTPAMVQVALGQNAYRLFDTAAVPNDAAFETLTAQIVAAIVPQQAALTEYFKMSAMEQVVVAKECDRLGWKPAELTVEQLMKVFKSKTPKPATKLPGNDEPPATDQEKRDMLSVFPQAKPNDWWFQDNIGAWRALAQKGDVRGIKMAVQSAGAKMSGAMYRAGTIGDPASALALLTTQWLANRIPAVGNGLVLDGKRDLIKQLAGMLPEPARSQNIQRADDLRAAGDADALDAVRDTISGDVRSVLVERLESLTEKVEKLPAGGPAQRHGRDCLREAKRDIETDLNLIQAQATLDEIKLR